MHSASFPCRRGSLPAALLALVGATGCDIVQGLGDAGRAIFPGDATYVNAPGSRIAAGNFSALDFAGVWVGDGAIGFKLLARTALPEDDSLSVIGFTNGSVCRIEHVGAYRTPTVAGPGEPMLWYLDGPGPRGTLRYVDQDCRPLPAVVPDAALSSASTSDGRRIVVSGSDLVTVDPGAGTIVPLERDVERLATRANGPFLVQTGGQLAVYDGDWQLQARYGDGVVRFGYIAYSARIAFEDAHGIWLAASGGPALSVAADGCDLGFSLWQPLYITFRLPCTDGDAVAYRPDVVDMVDLGPEVNSKHAEFWMEGPVPPQKLWVAYYRDFDEELGLGTLIVRSEDGRETIIGERAAPEWFRPTASGRGGVALVHVEGEVGDIVSFDAGGTVAPVAERALRENDGVGVLVNFDGVAGDMGGLSSLGGFARLLSRVPRHNYSYANQSLTAGAAFSDYDGHTGTLSRLSGGFGEMETVATRVLHPHHGFIDSLFPGMAWIRAHGNDDTGTLEYQNSALLYTATVSEGVAAFLPTTEGLIYTVPRGAGAGVWFADAK